MNPTPLCGIASVIPTSKPKQSNTSTAVTTMSLRTPDTVLNDLRQIADQKRSLDLAYQTCIAELDAFYDDCLIGESYSSQGATLTRVKGRTIYAYSDRCVEEIKHLKHSIKRLEIEDVEKGRAKKKSTAHHWRMTEKLVDA